MLSAKLATPYHGASDRKVDEQYRVTTTMADIPGEPWSRPALQRLLKDIEDRRVDIIVVYKVDRLPRSLADFAKIVEALDVRGVSFVSVTQQFNTTSSMGRLTLNVLLSFALAREVTGERIRDKIAASKRKDRWMAGASGAKERKLIVKPEEGDSVRRVFLLYLALGCVSGLKVLLDKEEIRVTERTSPGREPVWRNAVFPRRVVQTPAEPDLRRGNNIAEKFIQVIRLRATDGCA